MITNTNPFANYTLSIATQYNDTRAALIEAEKEPEKNIDNYKNKKYNPYFTPFQSKHQLAFCTITYDL